MINCQIVVKSCRRTIYKTNKQTKWLKSLFLFSLCTKTILVASKHYCWTTNVTWTILMPSLLPFWALNVSVDLLYTGSKISWISSKHLNLCSEDERRSYGFGTTREWVINNRIFIFGWTNPLINLICWTWQIHYYCVNNFIFILSTDFI